MKPKTLILMIVAVVCGLAASYMTSKVLSEQKAQEVEKVSVLVARRNLAMGTLISDPEKLFEEKQFTKGEEPKKAIRDFEELKGQRLNKPLTAEQFVTADDLNSKDKDGLSAFMRKGMRAVGLNVNAASVVGGFVLPHSHVDIVSVVTNPNGEVNAKIILQNILVLAVDQNASRPDDKQAVIATTVTVQVTPDQAEKLALADKMGTLRLILRSFDDEEKVATTGANPKGLNQGDNKLDDQFADSDSGSPRPRTPSWQGRVPDVPPVMQDSGSEPKPAETPTAPRPVHTMVIYNGQTPTKAIFTVGDKDGDVNTRIEKSQPDAEPTAKAQPPAATLLKP